MQKFFLFVFISILYYSTTIYGQNFAAGNPFLSDAEQSLPLEKEICFSFTYRNASSNQYFKEDHAFNVFNTSINHNFITKAHSNYAEFRTVYGFSPKISASFELGYFFDKTVHYEYSTYKGYGLGDAALYIKYRLYYNKTAQFTLLPAFGIKLPIGVFDQNDGNIILPISVQPSSGNFKYIGSIFMSKVMTEKLSIASNCSYEYAQLIDSENFYYKYGDQWMLSFYAKYLFSEKISADMQFRFENKDKSHIVLDKIVESSGYKIVFVTPQISYGLKNNWLVSVYADLPVYRYYNGIQFATSYTLSVKLLKKLDLSY